MARWRVSAQHTDFVGRAEGAAQQTEAHQLLQPLTVKHIALAAGDVLDVARVDEKHSEAAPLQQLEHRDPVHARGLHRHGIHVASIQAVGQPFDIACEAPELANGLVIAVRWDGTVVRSTADVDAGGVGVGEADAIAVALASGDRPIALRHAVLHDERWNVASVRVRRLDHSLKRDIALRAWNPHDDSPMSMTQPMTTLTDGQSAPLLLRSSPAPRSTLPQGQTMHYRVFLRDDLRRRRADYFANPSVKGASQLRKLQA